MLLHQETTDKILKAFYQVTTRWATGFWKKVYENALAIALRKQGMRAEQQLPICVYFEGELVGEYFADIHADAKVMVEVKAAEAIHPAHEAQLLNYLRATSTEVGLLLNFGPKPEFRRKLFSNERKTSLPPF
ncbi:MAG: GxxExxY protein [Planctomycetaceae bacterium]|nr:GxxExxY protein [Planctomycetaceae bacterium]